MKRLFVTLALFAFVFSNSSFASEGHAYPVFLQSFFKTFSNTKDVKWSEVNGYTRVAFKQDDKQKYAFYNSTGELVVVSSEIEMEVLPSQLQSALKSKFGNYSVTGVYEFKTGERTEYYVALDNVKKKIVLSSTGHKWGVFSSEKK